MKETVRGPNWRTEFCGDFDVSSRYEDDGWGEPVPGITFARAEANTFQYKAEDHGAPLFGYHSVGVEGPNARAKCRATSKGVGGSIELSAGKVSSEVGYMKAELNPNLTTGASIGANGIETRVGGMGTSISTRGATFHTPIGSLGLRFPKFGK